MKKNNILAFTLVELIVVITIVGILSTVGFVSYSGYLTWARDSNRISQMVKMSDSLQVYATAKSLPLPDDYVEVTATGVVLLYQWYAGTDVLETIDYTNGWIDPKDDTYFTYNVSRDRKQFQFTSFLEEEVASLFMPQSMAIDYSERNIKSYGKTLWIYTDENNTPIQEISTLVNDWFLDIFSTNDSYTVHFWDGKILTWDSTVLRWAIWWGGLIWYWSFESLNGTNFQDNSINNATWIASWWVTVDADGVIWNSVQFDWIDGEYVVPQILWVGSNWASPHTISAWIKPTAIPWDCWGNNSCREWVLWFWDVTRIITGTHLWLIWWYEGNRFWIWNWSQWDTRDLQSWVWTHVASVYDGTDITIYLNGKQVPPKKARTYTEWFNLKNSWLNLWRESTTFNEENYDGKIDELRIYARDLDFQEVQNIYNSEKKALGL